MISQRYQLRRPATGRKISDVSHKFYRVADGHVAEEPVELSQPTMADDQASPPPAARVSSYIG